MIANLHGGGEVIKARTVAHISATARPEVDPDAVVRVFFERATCAA
jgi:hypothetical protein